MELKSWYSICTPHEDIRKGNLDESTFAVDLWGVVNSSAPQMYLDAEEFFKKTFITEGLKSVLSKASTALFSSANSSDRILGLQTSFGGGKTHLLLALYHFAKESKRQKILENIDGLKIESSKNEKVNVAVFTNKTCDVAQGRKTDDGILIKTIWGEIAYQLGGKDLYSLIEVNDRERIYPQGKFEEVLKKASPCIILIDELADYCVAAAGTKVEKTTLADQTISFVQQLSGAVAKTPKTMVVSTLPASFIEVGGGELGESILQALETRYFREAVDIKPVQDQEIYQVIRRRLFDSVGSEKEIETVVNAYYEMYKEHNRDVPSEATLPEYKRKISEAYPFHPELIEILYHKWGSHSAFQRTRGVLRLLATLIADQWNRKNSTTQKCSLIHPCHINWTSDAWSGSLTRLWGNPYQTVVAADVNGESANAVLIDRKKDSDYEVERITEGIASSILLNSFGSKAERAGSNIKEIRLSSIQPHLNWGLTDGAIIELEDKAFYLHTTTGQEKRYWFSTKPTVRKLIVQYRNELTSKSFDVQIEEMIKSQAGTGISNLKVLVNPGNDLAEQKSLTLIILPPSTYWTEEGKNNAEQTILKLSKNCGRKERLYRNTLLFLAPTENGARNLQNAFREVVVLESVLSDYASQLEGEDKKELRDKIDDAKKTMVNNFSSAYSIIARVEKETILAQPLSEPRTGVRQYLETVLNKTIEFEWVQSKIGTVTFEESGLIPKENGIKLKDAVDFFLRFTDKPMITQNSVVINAVNKAAMDGRVGIGLGSSINNLGKKFCKNLPYIDWFDDGIWIIPPFESEPGNDEGSEPGKFGVPEPSVTDESTKTAETTIDGKKIKKIIIKGDIPLEEWSQIFRSFVQPSTQMNLKKQKLNIEFEFEANQNSPLSAEDNKVKAMKESAKQLGLEFREE